jgi:hypothetical protein
MKIIEKKKKPVSLPCGLHTHTCIVAKPVQIHTRGPWVWVLAGTGKDDLNFTHGLPVSNTT